MQPPAPASFSNYGDFATIKTYMGYVVKFTSVAEKSQFFSYLRSKELSQIPTPMHTKGWTMLAACIFSDHFYSAHYEDVDGVMEGESMQDAPIGYVKQLLNNN